MRRIAALTLALLSLAVLAGPVVAQQNVNPLDVLADAFRTPAGQEFAAQFLKEPVPGRSSTMDPMGDFEHSTGEQPGFTPDFIDITDTWVLDLEPGMTDMFRPTDANQVWAPTGDLQVAPQNHDPFHTITGEMPQDGSQYSNGALLFGMTLAATPPLMVNGRCEFVVWINDSSRGPTFVNHPNFPGDPAGGTNVAFGLGINPESFGITSTFTLVHESKVSPGFLNRPDVDVRAFVTPNYVGITVPKEQIGTLAGVNFYTFCFEEEFNFDASVTGADQTGLIEVDFDDLGSVAFEEIVLQTTTTTTTTIGTTSTVPSSEGTTTLPTTTSSTSDDGESLWWILLILGGIGLAILGWFLYGGKDPCKELYEAWLAAQAACDEAQGKADDAADDCEEADLDLEDLEKERKELCKAWPPACWSSDDGGWIEDDQGNRITSRDLHMRRMALGELWSDYRAKKLSAQQVQDAWNRMDTPEFRQEMRDLDEMYGDMLSDIDSDLEEAKKDADEACKKAVEAQRQADEACAKASAARKAYDECIGAAVADVLDAGAGGGEEGTDGGPTGPSGPGVASTPGSPQAPKDPCEDVDPKRRVIKLTSPRPERIMVNVDFSIITGRAEGSERNIEAGEQLVTNLSDLARDLDFAGDMLSARSAGLHIGAAANGFNQGKYVATAAGVVRGSAEALSATTDLVPDVPTSPIQAGTEFLEKTAQLGAFVAGKVTEWMRNYQIFTVRRSFFYQNITATHYEIQECRKGKGWVCVEKVVEYDVSQLKVLKGRDRWFTMNSSVRRRQFQSEVGRLSQSAINTIRNDAQRLADFRARHEPGSC